MTPITKHDGKLVVRHPSKEPTPFLFSLAPHLDIVRRGVHEKKRRDVRAIDVGCGNGRNAFWLKENFGHVIMFDLKPFPGIAIDLEKQDLPVFNHSVDLVICNYVLMFLSDETINMLVPNLFEMCGSPGMVVIEVQPVKTCGKTPEQVARIMDLAAAQAATRGWKAIRRSRYKAAYHNWDS